MNTYQCAVKIFVIVVCLASDNEAPKVQMPRWNATISHIHSNKLQLLYLAVQQSQCSIIVMQCNSCMMKLRLKSAATSTVSRIS